ARSSRPDMRRRRRGCSTSRSRWRKGTPGARRTRSCRASPATNRVAAPARCRRSRITAPSRRSSSAGPSFASCSTPRSPRRPAIRTCSRCARSRSSGPRHRDSTRCTTPSRAISRCGTHFAPRTGAVVRAELDGRRRVIIEAASPEVDAGAFPAKRVAGDVVAAEADIFADGHDLISAVVLHRPDGEKKWREVRMHPLANDRWRAEFTVETIGFHRFTVEGWIDHFLTWRRDLEKRTAEEDLRVQLLIGAQMIREAAARAGARDRRKLESFLAATESDDPIADRIEDLRSEDLLALMWRNAERKFVTRYERELLIEVDRPRAAFSAWYELFPRSVGTFRDVEAQLPRVAKMGFDILYFPPIHPIGTTYRKGKNNRVSADADDAGSPWAIGGAEGGHKSVHPRLGTIEDFERLVAKAKEHGLEIAMDIAFQASPDHPYVREHLEWFLARPDG